MPRIIDADELIKVLDDTLAEQSKDADIRELLQKSLLVGFAKQVIEDAPTVDAETKQAYVIVDEDGNMECSNCGSSNCFDNYCGHCGAKLIGERKVEVKIYHDAERDD